MARTHRSENGFSLAKGPVGLLGLAMIAYGVLAYLFGGTSFDMSPVDGTVSGDTFLGIEGNGWTNALWVAAGLLLVFGAPMHWGAKSMAIIVGLALGAASVISIFDGDDVFGIFAANGPTMLAWGASAAALLVLALLPRVGGGRKRHRHDADDVHVERSREGLQYGEREPLGFHDSDRVDDRTKRFTREEERTAGAERSERAGRERL